MISINFHHKVDNTVSKRKKWPQHLSWHFLWGKAFLEQLPKWYVVHWLVTTRWPPDILCHKPPDSTWCVLHILGCYRNFCRPTELTLRTSAERNTVTHWSWRGFYSNTILSPAPKVPNLKVLPSQERTDLCFAGADFKVHVLSLPVRTYLQLGLQVKCDYIFHSVQSVQTA